MGENILQVSYRMGPIQRFAGRLRTSNSKSKSAGLLTWNDVCNSCLHLYKLHLYNVHSVPQSLTTKLPALVQVTIFIVYHNYAHA